jgi:hypothetical protein
MNNLVLLITGQHIMVCCSAPAALQEGLAKFFGFPIIRVPALLPSCRRTVHKWDFKSEVHMLTHLVAPEHTVFTAGACIPNLSCHVWYSPSVTLGCYVTQCAAKYKAAMSHKVTIRAVSRPFQSLPAVQQLQHHRSNVGQNPPCSGPVRR